MAFTVLFDADVLVPTAQRDLMIRLAQAGLFRGRWSNQILDEMEQAILRRQPELGDKLARTRHRPVLVATILQRLADALRNPPQTIDDVLATLEKVGLKRSVAELRLRLKP